MILRSALRRLKPYILMVFIMCFVILATTPSGADQDLRVTRVIDGDSYVLSNGLEIRLIGVDTPEYRDAIRNRRNAKRLGVMPGRYANYAQRAEDFALRVIRGKDVRLVLDDANEYNNHQDKYDRVLAYLYVPESQISRKYHHPIAKGTGKLKSYINYNAILIAEGQGFAYTRFPFKFSDEFRALQAEAKYSRRGYWDYPSK